MPTDEDLDIDRRELEKKRFRMDSGFNIAHILTTVGMLIALFSWGSEINSNQAVQASEISNIKTDRMRERTELMVVLHEMNRKLDCLQRGNKGVC